MNKLIKEQSKTIQEMRDFQENITLANKERDEQLEEIQKMTESFSKKMKSSDESAVSSQSSQLEEEIENLNQKLKNYTSLTDAEEQHLHEKRMFGDYNSFKCDLIGVFFENSYCKIIKREPFFCRNELMVILTKTLNLL